MARKPAQPIAANSVSHQSIAQDLAAFRKRGGRIEVLGDTPLRKNTASAFRSSTKSQRKGPTPVEAAPAKARAAAKPKSRAKAKA